MPVKRGIVIRRGAMVFHCHGLCQAIALAPSLDPMDKMSPSAPHIPQDPSLRDSVILQLAADIHLAADAACALLGEGTLNKGFMARRQENIRLGSHIERSVRALDAAAAFLRHHPGGPQRIVAELRDALASPRSSRPSTASTCTSRSMHGCPPVPQVLVQEVVREVLRH